MSKFNASKWKDEILQYLNDNIPGSKVLADTISENLNFPMASVVTLASEMQSDKNVIIEARKDVQGSGWVYHIYITGQGIHFLSIGGYTAASKKINWEKFPKTYWWLLAIISFLAGLFADLIKDRFKKEPSSIPIQIIVKKDTVINVVPPTNKK